MSEQSQTTANTPSDPVLCKMGCGFFGNSATGGCCSKCWRDKQNKESATSAASDPVVKSQPSESASVASQEEASSTVTEKEVEKELPKEPEAPVAAPKKKKGKKKQSYKSMMAGMITTSNSATKADKEKDALRKVTGGGAFSKIEKI